MARTFEASKAVRKYVPIHIGIVGASGSGKTYSALRLATGIKAIYGGDIFGIDSEANRMLHYADQFDFQHVPFGAPFNPASYLDAVKFCVSKGAKTIIIDSASHMHDGPGGTLESHESECDRLVKQWNSTRDKVQMSSWAKPKAELRQFINEILQMNVNIIWCFRAKEKIKLIGGKTPQAQGWMPISGDDLIYEMTLNMLMYPGSGGIPTWQTDEIGERAMIKLPVQFNDIFKDRKPLDENIGKMLAKWAFGSQPEPIKPANTPAQQVANAFQGTLIDSGDSKPISNPVTKDDDPRLSALKSLLEIRAKYDQELPKAGKDIIDQEVKNNDITLEKIHELINRAKASLAKKGINL